MKLKFSLLPIFLFLISFSASDLLASERGKSWFKLCKTCHGMNGEGRQDLGAPSIAGMPAWYLQAQLLKFRDGIRGNHPKDYPGMRMRPMARMLNQDADIEAVAGYVESLPRPSLRPTITGSVIKGEQSYQTCVPCHGANGKGNKELSAPPLVQASDWYLMVQLNNFKNKIRAYDPSTDATGATMTGIAMLLNDESMADVIAYINALGSGGQ